jgi:hypothetical protein
MLRRLGLFTGTALAVLLLAGRLPAQNPSSVTDEIIENALDGLRTPLVKIQDGYTFKVGDRSFAILRLQKGAKLLIKTAPSRLEASLKTINHYNEEVAVTTRAVRYAKGGLVLEASPRPPSASS